MGIEWVQTQHCGCWCPGVKETGLQYTLCWLIIFYTGPISAKNITFVVNSIMKKKTNLKKNDPVVRELNFCYRGNQPATGPLSVALHAAQSICEWQPVKYETFQMNSPKWEWNNQFHFQ